MRRLALLLLATGCHQGVDPYTVPVLTSERLDRSLCAMVSTSDAIAIGRNAVLGTAGTVKYSSGTFTMTRIEFETERVLFGTAPSDVDAVFHGGVGNGDHAPKNHAFVGDLTAVLAGNRGVWFLQVDEGITGVAANGVFSEEVRDVFTATELEERRYSLAQILEEIALRGAAPRNNRGCSR